MPTQNYINPFGMMPQNSDFASPSFLQVLMAHRNREMSMPFIQNAQQMQQMEMQRQQMETQEFTSPEAAEARMTGFQATTAQNRNKIANAPILGEKEREEAKARIKELPYITEKNIADAEQLTIEARGKPAQKLLDEMGAIHEQLQRLPEHARNMAYQEQLRSWQQRNPGAQVPPNFRQYNPQLLAMARYASINTPKHVQDLEQTKLKGLMDIEARGVSAQATRDAAAISAQSGSSQKRNNQQERNHYMRIYTDPNANPEDRQVAYETLEGLATDEFEKVKKSDKRLSNMDIDYILANAPEEKEQITRLQEKREAELWEQHLIRRNLRVKVQSPDGKIGTIPKHKLDDYKRQGFKEVR